MRLHGDQENIWIHSPVLNVDVNVLCLFFCGTLMAVQVDKTLLAFFLPEDFKFEEEDKVLTVADLAYSSSEIHFEYLRKQEECLIYVADMSVFSGVVLISVTN